PNAEAIYHDTCNEAQASQLLETAHALYTLLGNGENGQAWLCEQAEQPTRLFGMALFNFNPEIAALIQQVTRNFSTTGKLDDQDGASILSPSVSGDATNIGSRLSEIKGVLDLESVRTSKLYQAMSNAAQHSLTTLINIANHQAKDAWHGLSGMLLPAMKQQAALTLAVPQVLISTEISSATQLTFNPTYPRDYQAWLLQLITVQKKITSAKAVLQRPGPAYDQRAARLSLQTLEAQAKNLFLQRPNQITAKASGNTRLPASLSHINGWLTHLGQAEVMAQLKVAGTYEYLTRTKAWMNQNLGNALPALLVGLNVWNTHNIAKQAQNNGRFTADELRTMGSSAAYAANAIAALWVGPAWNRAGGMSAEIGRKTVKLAKAGYMGWLAEAKAASSGSHQANIANNFAKAAKGLILRTVTWASFGAIAAGLEAWQIFKDTNNTTSKQENVLFWAKLGKS
ncbi:T6SS effector BTH_I2691 family protein, partial [Pseudomonas sp. SDO528_S397]